VIVAPSPQDIDDRDAEKPSGASITLIPDQITQIVALEQVSLLEQKTDLNMRYKWNPRAKLVHNLRSTEALLVPIKDYQTYSDAMGKQKIRCSRRQARKRLQDLKARRCGLTFMRGEFRIIGIRERFIPTLGPP